MGRAGAFGAFAAAASEKPLKREVLAKGSKVRGQAMGC